MQYPDFLNVKFTTFAIKVGKQRDLISQARFLLDPADFMGCRKVTGSTFYTYSMRVQDKAFKMGESMEWSSWNKG